MELEGTNSLWILLKDVTSSTKENTLQNIFNNWHQGRDGWEVAGAPLWLLAKTNANSARQIPLDDYAFTPDVFWPDQNPMVMELKRSNKYEEISLVEVLHHAWHLGNLEMKGGRYPLPVVVSGCSPWMRSALCYLFAHGLRRDSIRLLEATFLRSSKGGQFLWLYEPFAEWVPSPCNSLPAWIPQAWQRIEKIWFHVHDCETWVAAPLDWTHPRPYTPYPGVFVAKVHGKHKKYLVWVGSSEDSYFLWDGTCEGSDEIPKCELFQENLHATP